jgi:hypothetical protein
MPKPKHSSVNASTVETIDDLDPGIAAPRAIKNAINNRSLTI